MFTNIYEQKQISSNNRLFSIQILRKLSGCSNYDVLDYNKEPHIKLFIFSSTTSRDVFVTLSHCAACNGLTFFGDNLLLLDGAIPSFRTTMDSV